MNDNKETRIIILISNKTDAGHLYLLRSFTTTLPLSMVGFAHLRRTGLIIILIVIRSPICKTFPYGNVLYSLLTVNRLVLAVVCWIKATSTYEPII